MVSPKWWSYLWLNEGLAKFYETELLKLVIPEETVKIERQFEAIRFYAYSSDNHVSTNPMNHYVEKLEDISKKFDNIIYHKAACIIQMFQNVVGVETWKKGIKYYLEDNQYSAIEPNDLHKAVQKSLDEDNPGNFINIDKLMTSWENQAGFPKISASLVDGILKLSQKRDVDDVDLQNVVYNIPITYSTSSNPNFDDFSTKFWLTEKEMEIKDFTDNWIVFNNQQNGYYKVDYDENLWNRIIDQLHANHTVIHHINREHLFISRLHKLNADNHVMSSTLRLLTYLKHEDNVYVLLSMQVLLKKFLEANRNDRAIKSELKEVLEVVYPKTKHKETIFEIKSVSNQLGVQAALDDSFNDMMNILEHPHKNAKLIFCDGLQYANEKIVDTVMDALRLLNDTELIGPILYGLGCVESVDLYKKVLTVLFERGNEVSATNFYSFISNLDTEEKIDVFLTFLEENYVTLQEKSRDLLEFLLINSISSMKTDYQTDRLKNLKNETR